MIMVSQVINIGKMMKFNAFTEKGKRNIKTRLRVSPGAIQEYMGRVIDGVETNLPLISIIAKKHNRSTVFEEDIIEFFGLKSSNVIEIIEGEVDE